MFALYIHVPFCPGKCPYCDFFSLPVQDESLAGYANLLSRQLEIAPRAGWDGPLSTVFFGGGTPSLLESEDVSHVLRRAEELFGLEKTAEISLEANPGTVSRDKLAGYAAAGVNRLSLGVQALDEAALRQLGRRHDTAQALQAVAWARAAGFGNLSLDLIYGRPGQTLDLLVREIERFLALEPEHLSAYALTIEAGTPLADRHARGSLVMPDEELVAAHYEMLHERLTAAGYEHYEISNYARPGYRCRHNLNYWARGPYLGVGAGAHTFRDLGWGERWATPADLDLYRASLEADCDPAVLLERFDRDQAMRETFYLGLRTAQGIRPAEFATRYGMPPEEAFPGALKTLRTKLNCGAARWRFRWSDWLLYDHLIQAFF